MALRDDLACLVSDESRSARLLRFGYLLSGNGADAADLVQDALVRVLSRSSQESGIDNLEAFVRKAMVRLQLNRTRRDRLWLNVRQFLVTSQQQQSSDEAIAYRDVVEKALDRLTPTQRAAFSLQFYEDYSVAEIAEVLGCSVGGVKRHLSDARHRLSADLSLQAKGILK